MVRVNDKLWLDARTLVLAGRTLRRLEYRTPARTPFDYTEMVLHAFDVHRTDQTYWRSVKRFFDWLAIGVRLHGWHRYAYKALRQAHFETLRKDWDDVLPSEIVTWAMRAIATDSEGLDCVDNDRCARLGNTAQMRRFERQKSDGCCGCGEFRAVGPDGNKYILGYNFGH